MRLNFFFRIRDLPSYEEIITIKEINYKYYVTNLYICVNYDEYKLI